MKPARFGFKPVTVQLKNVFFNKQINRGIRLDSKVLRELRQDTKMTIREFKRRYGMS